VAKEGPFLFQYDNFQYRNVVEIDVEELDWIAEP
jgi:hypothetical protein